MSDLSTAATSLAVLAERARAEGHRPWLFHRDGLDWEWRSWRRVADQVARGMAALRAVGVAPEARQRTAPRRAGYDRRQHPDAVAAGLAIRAAGWVAVPARDPEEASARGCDAWVEVDGRARPPAVAALERIQLPAARSALDRTPRQALVLDGSSAGDVELPGREAMSAADLWSAARRLDRRLEAGGRPIVCADPDLDPAAALLLEAWTLLRGAAWVLEPDAPHFLDAVLWARPTVVWACPPGLERLAARLALRKHRRHSRLETAVAAGGAAAEAEPWRALGVDVVALGADPLAP